MYRLLVLDMDGTLLNENSQISEANIEAVRLAREAGVKVVIATGRTKPGIDPFLSSLGLAAEDEYSIVCSGAQVLSNLGDEIYSRRLSRSDLDAIRERSEALGLDWHVYSDSVILTEGEGIFCQFDAAANNMPLCRLRRGELDPDMPVYKIMLSGENEKILETLNRTFPGVLAGAPEMDRLLNRAKAPKTSMKSMLADPDSFPLSFHESYNISMVFDDIVEISSRHSNKAAAVAYVAQKLGIDKASIICIGDSQNDRHMIEYAGLGIAMGNASVDLKLIADDVTLGNDEDGVARAIEKHILGQMA